MDNLPSPQKGNESQSPILTNAERLKASLTHGSLAAALFAAWEAGDPSDRQARMLAAVHGFYAPKQDGHDQAVA